MSSGAPAPEKTPVSIPVSSQLPFLPDLGVPGDWSLACRLCSSRYYLADGKLSETAPLAARLGPLIKNYQSPKLGLTLEDIISRSAERRKRLIEVATAGWPDAEAMVVPGDEEGGTRFEEVIPLEEDKSRASSGYDSVLGGVDSK